MKMYTVPVVLISLDRARTKVDLCSDCPVTEGAKYIP